MVKVKHHNLLLCFTVYVSKRCMDHFTLSKKFVVRKEELLFPMYLTIFKREADIPVPLLLFFSDCATCITSAAASLTTKSSFCSSRTTHFHIARVLDSPICSYWEKQISSSYTHSKKLQSSTPKHKKCSGTLKYQEEKCTGKPLGRQLAIWWESFQHVWTLFRWLT